MCKHTTVKDGDERCFTGAPVAVPPYTDENPAAHGSLQVTEECVACGAQRKVAVNGGHREYGVWGPSAEERRQEQIQARREKTKRAEEEEDLALTSTGIMVVRANESTVTVSQSDGRHQVVPVSEIRQAAGDHVHSRMGSETPEQRITRLAYRAVLRHSAGLAAQGSRREHLGAETI